MAQMMQYDDTFTKKLERIYSTPDVIGQRDKVMVLANIQQGEHALDIGIGPGMTTQAIARRVGETGQVVGIDISDTSLAMAKKRCADQPWVSIEPADAVNLPFDDETFDVAISTQVYEYVEDIDKALSELHRVLKTGGRAVILDCDWDSCVWNTRNRERMQRIIDLWNSHCSHPFLPRALQQCLEKAGFVVVKRDIYTIFNPDYDPDTYSYGTIDFMQSYLQGLDNIDQREVDAWAEELHDLGQNGDYFFSLNRYIFVVTKP